MKNYILIYMLCIACIAQETTELEDLKKSFFSATDVKKCLVDGIKIVSHGDRETLVIALTCDNMVTREAAASIFFLAYHKPEENPAYVRDFKLELVKNDKLYQAIFTNLQSEHRKMNKFAAKLIAYCLKEEMIPFINNKLKGDIHEKMTAASFLAFMDKNRCELKPILASGLDNKDDFIRTQAIVGIGKLKCEKQEELAKIIAMFATENSMIKSQIIRACEITEEGMLATSLLLDAITDKLVNSTDKEDQSLNHKIINLLHLRGAKGVEVEEKALLCLNSKGKYVDDKAIDVLANLEITQHQKVQDKMLEILLDENRLQQTRSGASRVLKNMAVHLSDETLKKLEELVEKGIVSEGALRKIKKKRKKARKAKDT